MPLEMNSNEIHVWSFSLAATHEADAFTYLTPDEQQRANRLIQPLHQQRFISARATLRQLLSHYLALPAQDIRFGYNEHKKPYLLFPSNSRLTFNLAHSHDRAVYAFGLDHALGIDIEKMTETDHHALAQRYFSTQEKNELNALPQAEKKEGFYRLWTRKEALLKAVGKGLSIPLASFSVSSKNIIETVSLMDQPWQLIPLSIDPAYQSVLATQPHIHTISYWEKVNNQTQLKKRDTF